MPFGGRHADAGRTLAQLVPPRLAKNEKLHKAIAKGMKEHVVSNDGGPWEFGMTIPFDGHAMERLFEYVVRGLAWHHWKLLLRPDVLVRAMFLVEAGQRHQGKDHGILAQRHAVYESAKAARPERWSGATRNWTPVGAVMLNPEREDIAVPQAA